MRRDKRTESADLATPARGLSRRGLLGLAGAGVAGIGLGVAGDRVSLAASASPGAASASAVYPFYGSHQAGIVTPAQDRLHFAAFDVSAGVTRAELIELLQDWTVAAASMSAGLDVGEYGAVSGPYDAPPEDTGEAQGLPTAGLTITFGFGPTLFETADGADRFGLAARRPADLTPLPHFPGDDLDAGRSDGDLCIQACSTRSPPARSPEKKKPGHTPSCGTFKPMSTAPGCSTTACDRFC